MGGDAQFVNGVQLINTSKPTKLVCTKYKQIYSACLLSGLIRQLFESSTKLIKIVVGNSPHHEIEINFSR